MLISAEIQGKSIEEVELMLLDLPQVDCPVVHKFSPGLYIRELFMPAGTFAIGHHQNKPHFNVMLAGKVVMLNSDGSKTEITAPYSFTSDSGRKIGYVLEDMVWQNIYPTEETNIDKLEETYLTKSDTFKLCKDLKFSSDELAKEPDRIDFNKMVEELGVSHELIQYQSENTDDVIELILEDSKIKIGKSPIHGIGLFATSCIDKGEIISLARIDGYRTQAGRYTNHSANPNAVMVAKDRNVFLVANKDISGCKGADLGEEITIDYRQAVCESAREAICQQYL